MENTIFVGDIVEENGKTWKQNNMDKEHKYQLGTVVDIEMDIDEWNNMNVYSDISLGITGKVRLIVVGHTRDCDGAPLYCLSDFPVQYPYSIQDIFKYRIWCRYSITGICEEQLTTTGLFIPLEFNSITEYENQRRKEMYKLFGED